MTGKTNGSPSEKMKEPSGETAYSLISSLFSSKVMVLIKGQCYTVGRSQSSDIIMPHEAISKKHARIEWIDEGFWIQDVGSTNGTIVNGREIVKERLNDNDLIEIYPWRIRYKEFRGDINILLGEELSEESLKGTQILSETIKKRPLSSSGLSGTFRDMELIEVCQLIEFCKKNGTLKVEGEGKEGKISFSMGRIAWAESKGLKGEKAVRELLSIPKGRFEFLGTVSLGKEKLSLPLSKLLMDIMRENDELGVIENDHLDLDFIKD